MDAVKAHLQHALGAFLVTAFRVLYQKVMVQEGYFIADISIQVLPDQALIEDQPHTLDSSDRLQLALDHIHGLDGDPTDEQIREIAAKWADADELEEFEYNLISFMMAVRNGELD